MQKSTAKEEDQHKAHLQPRALAKIAPDDLNLQIIWFMSNVVTAIGQINT